MKKIYLFLFAFVLFVPLGLISENPAWGEWDTQYYKELLGFIPKGIEDAKSISPIIPDYSVSNLGDVSGYYISAIVGIGLIYLIFFGLKRFVVER